MKKVIEDLSKHLVIEQIDFRIQSINRGGYAKILAYKDARVDMNRLDEVVGHLNWQKKYEVVNGQLFCSVGIYDAVKKDWVWKSDVGIQSMTEKEKGVASDSFKRACFNWGIGRELYDYPEINVKLFPNEFIAENDRVKQTFDLKLKEWRWKVDFDDDGNVIYLGAIHKQALRFEFKK
jgi:hypothetical protein